MASAFGHAAAALALGTAFHRRGDPRWVWAAGALGAALPDADVIGLYLGVPYGSPFGHRGFTHALLTAALLAWAAARRLERGRLRLGIYLFLAVASHGLLDMLTTGGRGVALFWPFWDGRLFFPWRPILVSPIGVGRFLGARGLAVLRSEAVWIGIPSLAFAGLGGLVRRILPRFALAREASAG